jgi:TrmH family RNA methyltransferase
VRITTRNARFQQWQALLTNRTKRQRAGAFLIHGVRPISRAAANGWPLEALLYRDGASLSRWAHDILAGVGGGTAVFAVAPELLAELSDKADDVELVAVARLPADDLTRIAVGPGFLGVVFDRPNGPGNIGTLLRAADAFGSDGVVVTGHAADAYDPKAVRASTGSIVSVPVVRLSSHRPVLDWLAGRGAVVGADESAEVDAAEVDLTGPTLLVIGNETVGLSAAWRQACDRTVRIPMSGDASSLNAATAASILLYEVTRQRRAAGRA